MARYISPSLKRVHMAGGKIFRFQDGMLELNEAEDIMLLDKEIASIKERGGNPLMEKIPEVEVVPEVKEDSSIKNDIEELAKLAKEAKPKKS